MALPSPPLSYRRWTAILLGQTLFVFAVAALSGPGRIDIVDGQTRYEVSRSLVDYGDAVIRDSRIWFVVFPGREGIRYTQYRLPHSLAGVPAILAADATGPVSEGRRRFFFVWASAAALALLAPVYTLWFHYLGHRPAAAVGWSLAGIFCTPSWYYSTSTFDDLFGAATIVAAVVVAFVGRRRSPLGAATGAGLLLGLAFNFKQPLGLFVLPVLAALRDPERPLRAQWGRFALVCLGLAIGVAFYEGYDLYKYPPETWARRAELSRVTGEVWSQHPLGNFFALTVSPGAGVFWYCPPVILGLIGLASWRAPERRLCPAVLLACGGFLVFVSLLSYAKGDPTWGPRYLTPVCALLWLFTPDGAARLARRWVVGLLAAGFLVQVLGLSVDPHRRYMQLGLPSAFGYFYPEAFFHARVGHLPARPLDIIEIIQAGPTEEFTPAPEPTFTFPIIDEVYKQLGGPDADGSVVGPQAVQKYRILNSFRPWWISQRTLPEELRPVDLATTVIVLSVLLALGGGVLLLGLRGTVRSENEV